MNDSKLSRFKLHYEYDKPYRAMHYELHQLRKKFKKGGRMTKPKTITESDIIGSKETKLEKQEQKETTTVKPLKNFFKKPATIIVLTVVLTSATIYGGWKLYSFVYNQGYQDAVQQQKTVAKQVAELSKANQ